MVADDLAPSETVQMDKSKRLGFITRQGSSNSHTAILARAMNIPALIGIEIKKASGTENQHTITMEWLLSIQTKNICNVLKSRWMKN